MANTKRDYSRLLLDVDGILVDEQESTSPHAWRTLFALHEQGVPVSLVTARPYSLSKHLVKRLPKGGIHAFDCGAFVVDCDTKKVLVRRTLPRTVVSGLIKEFAMDSNNLEIGVSDGPSFYANKKLRRYLKSIIPTATVRPLKPLPRHITSLCIRGLSSNQARRSEKAFSPMASICIRERKNGDYALFVRPDGICKRFGATELSRLTGHSLNSTVFIGDDLDDLSALNAVGFGATTANGLAAVKKRCSMVSDRSYSDGMADVISSIWLNR